MRKISMIEFEELCKQFNCNSFSVSNEDSTSFDFALSFENIEFYYDTLILKSNSYYLKLRDITSVSVDDTSFANVLRFLIVCDEYLPVPSDKSFFISARRR